MSGMVVRFFNRLTRRKRIKDDEAGKSDLKRCLTTCDLIALGVGSTLGAGAYVLAGREAKESAGPAIVLSFLLAAIASILAGLCYSEFGARVPKAGSAYVYTYVTVGEIMAFVIGWNLILEYVIGAACVARTASGYVDNLIGDVLIPWFRRTLPISVPTLTEYFDLMSLCTTLLLTLLLIVGVKESVRFTKIFTVINVSILIYICVVGLFWDNPKNWALPVEALPNGTSKSETCRRHPPEGEPNCGYGGFMPYGIAGVTKGAARCFFGFVGFDGIAAAGEEAINPQRSIPIATIASLGIVFVVYSGISTTITMMTPYYALDIDAPFATVFAQAGDMVSKYIVSIGAICALTVSLICVMFPMPRVAFAMANDGLLFKVFSTVSPRFKTPVFATVATGIVAAVMSALFDVDALVDMMDIGTLLAYTLVSASVLLLRYDTFPEDVSFSKTLITSRQSAVSGGASYPDQSNAAGGSSSGGVVQDVMNNVKGLVNNSAVSKIVNPLYSSCATPFSANVVKVLCCIMSFWLVVFCVMLQFHATSIFSAQSTLKTVIFAIAILMIGSSLILIHKQPQSLRKLNFTVPFVPYLPAASMFFNVFLMVNLDFMTWIRFTVWMILGFATYFGYGMWHSREERLCLNEGCEDATDEAMTTSTSQVASKRA